MTDPRLSDEAIREALTVEPAAAVVVDVRERLRAAVVATPQSRHRWLPGWRGQAGGRDARPTLTFATAIVVIALTLVVAALIAAALRRDALPMPGAVLVGPTAGGVLAVGPDGTARTLFPSVGGRSAGFGWSSDGSRLAFLTQPEPGGSWSLVVGDPATGRVLHRLDAGAFGGAVMEPLAAPIQWSADASRLLASVSVDGHAVAFLVDVSDGRTIRVGNRFDDVAVANWSASRQQMAWVATRQFAGADKAVLVVADADGGRPVQIAPPQSGLAIERARWSADGRTLLVGASTEAGGRLLRVDPATGTWTLVTDRTSTAAESPDGRWIAAHVPATPAGEGQIWMIDAETGAASRVAEGACPRAAWAPDASRLLYHTGSCGTDTGTIEVHEVHPDGTGDVVRWSGSALSALGIMDLAWAGVGGQVDRP